MESSEEFIYTYRYFKEKYLVKNTYIENIKFGVPVPPFFNCK